MNRFTLASLMGMIAVAAAGLAALRHPSAAAAGMTCLVVFVALLVIAVGAVVRPSPAAGWRGGALFGWGYYLLAFHAPPIPLTLTLPTSTFVHSIAQALHPESVKPARPALARPGDPSWYQGVPGWSYVPGVQSDSNPVGFVPMSEEDAQAWKAYQAAEEDYSVRTPAISEMLSQAIAIGHSYMTILFALIGSIAGRALARESQGRSRPERRRTTRRPESSQPPTPGAHDP